MNNRLTNSYNTGNWIGVCTAVGVALFAATNEPTWLAVGVAIGAALGTRKPKGQKHSEIDSKNG